MNCLVAGNATRPCFREASHQDPISPGKIHDDEILCRAGYSMHHTDGNPKIGLIRSSDLAKGELSIWREAPATAHLSEIVGVLHAASPPAQSLDWVFGVRAKELRDLVEGSPICAVDDTDCGEGRRHKAHGVLAGCDHLGFKALAKPDENPTFSAVRRALLEIFSRNVRWKRETAARG
jgi:hypothetical protein